MLEKRIKYLKDQYDYHRDQYYYHINGDLAQDYDMSVPHFQWMCFLERWIEDLNKGNSQ